MRQPCQPESSLAADELASRLDQAEALHNEAEDDRLLAAQERDRLAVLAVAQEKEAAARRAAAEEEARRVQDRAKRDAADVVANAERAALKIRQDIEAGANVLREARIVFDLQKIAITEHAAKEAAIVALKVIAGVLSGDVGLKPDGPGWFIRDESLRQRVQALHLGDALREIVTTVSKLWEQLKRHLSPADLSQEQQRSAEAVRKVNVPPSRPDGGYRP